jgi:hypothetical protein
MSSIYRAVFSHSRRQSRSVALSKRRRKREEKTLAGDIKRTGCGLVALDYISIVHRPVRFHPHCRWLGGGNGGGIGARNGGNGGGPPGIPR